MNKLKLPEEEKEKRRRALDLKERGLFFFFLKFMLFFRINET